MMEIHKLHGLCKGFVHDQIGWKQVDLEDDKLLEQFKKGHEKHIPFLDQNTELNLFKTCLINLEGVSDSLNKQGQSEIWPMLDLFKIKSCQTFLQMIKIRSDFLKDCGCSWWQFLLQYLPYLPNDIGKILISGVPEDSLVKYLVILRMKQAGIDIEFNNKLEKLSLIEMCYFMKRILEEPEQEHLGIFSSTLLKIKDVGFIKVVESALIKEMQSLSVDIWMDLAEKTSKDLSSEINWWSLSNEMPSNQQMLIAHYCFEILKLKSDLAPILSNFAREYQREFELGLDDLEIDDIILILDKKNDLEDWKIEAYVQHVMKSSLITVQKSSKARNVMQKYAKYLVPYLNQICEMNTLEVFSLIVSILQNSELGVVHDKLEKRLKEELFSLKVIISENFEQNLRSFLNMTVTDEDYEKEWLILVFQNPKESVETLLKEGIENAGKLNLVVELLQKLPIFQSFDIHSKLVAKLEEATDENVANLIVKLSLQNQAFAERISKELLQECTKNEVMAIKTIDILVKIKGSIDFDQDVLETIEKALLLKNYRTLQEGHMLSLISKVLDKSEKLSDHDLIYKLPWMRPSEWKAFKANDIIEKVIILLDFITDDRHQEYLLKQLSEYLSENENYDQDIFEIHDKIVFLLNQYPDHQGLQNCQMKLLGKLLEQENIDFQHILSVFATMSNCDAKILSLTKLKMILEIE